MFENAKEICRRRQTEIAERTEFASEKCDIKVLNRIIRRILHSHHVDEHRPSVDLEVAKWARSNQNDRMNFQMSSNRASLEIKSSPNGHFNFDLGMCVGRRQLSFSLTATA